MHDKWTNNSILRQLISLTFFLLERIQFTGSLIKVWLCPDYGIRWKLVFFLLTIRIIKVHVVYSSRQRTPSETMGVGMERAGWALSIPK